LRSCVLAILTGAIFIGTGASQSSDTPPRIALLPGSDALKLCTRMVELMDSTGAVLPELQLATAPLVAGARNTLAALGKQPGSAGLTAQFTRQSRAFLAIADATPKPFPFPETALKQLAELRANYDRLESHLAALIADKEFQTRNPDRDNVSRYADANARVLPPGGSPRVVFMGDSITDFWHLNEYFTGRDFLNRGISGQVTSQMLGRFKEDVIDLHPRAVLILAGTNDISRGTPLNVIESNLVMMAELARINQIKVLIASVLPTGEQQVTRPTHTIQQLNSWIETYCTQSGATYVDYYSKMRAPAGTLQPDLADDGLHPNGMGYRIMAPIALTAIDRALGASSAPREPVRKQRVRVF
jgi:lysophospholipase L1-like esterase